MEKNKEQHNPKNEKGYDNNCQTVLDKQNLEYEKAFKEIIDKTESKNMALKKIIKAFNEVQ